MAAPRRTSSARASTSCGSPTTMLTVRAGYSRYFTPPPLGQVNNGAIATLAGTVAAPDVTTERPGEGRAGRTISTSASTVKPLRRPDLGLGAYYKIAQQPSRRRPVRRAHHPHLLQLRQGHRQRHRVQRQLRRTVPGRSISTSPWSAAAAPTSTPRSSISARPSSPTSPTTTSTSTTARAGPMSGGAAYTFNPDRDWATRVSADMMFGSGLRKTRRHPQRPLAARLRRGQRLAGAEDPDRPRQDDAGPFRRHQPVRQPATRSATARASASAPRSSAMRRTFLVTLDAKILTHNRHDLGAPDG